MSIGRRAGSLYALEHVACIEPKPLRQLAAQHHRACGTTANCIIIAQFPIENHSEQGQFAELPLKTIGKVQNLGDYYAIRSSYQRC